ncbi:VPLPA-CTERM sorting domain-containing protein [Roseospira marina]|nr:VPLPA-CTERM sorting domain-containing protein [Roseospira marina]MBB4313294.1 hypothetical protein [Roseospira marina]MBB5085965.1 hypothetical protein [Roseospira marina]
MRTAVLVASAMLSIGAPGVSSAAVVDFSSGTVEFDPPNPAYAYAFTYTENGMVFSGRPDASWDFSVDGTLMISPGMTGYWTGAYGPVSMTRQGGGVFALSSLGFGSTLMDYMFAECWVYGGQSTCDGLFALEEEGKAELVDSYVYDGEGDYTYRLLHPTRDFRVTGYLGDTELYSADLSTFDSSVYSAAELGATGLIDRLVFRAVGPYFDDAGDVDVEWWGWMFNDTHQVQIDYVDVYITPLPAAVWFLLTAIAGLTGVTRLGRGRAVASV